MESTPQLSGSSLKSLTSTGSVGLPRLKGCSKCKTEKVLDCFSEDRRKSDGRAPCCKECKNTYYRKHRKANPSGYRNATLKYVYGITLADFDAMWLAQHGACAICGGDGRLVVDHDHGTGEVRELLCAPCNTTLGRMKDSPSRLRAAADYLEKRGAS